MILNKLSIVVDTKNLALYSGGIASFFRPLLEFWVRQSSDIKFILVGPSFDLNEFLRFDNVLPVIVPWPEYLPRSLRHPFYDNFLFPRAIKKLTPDFIFTPYHDVRLPKNIPSIMMVHDTCIGDLPGIYPEKVRAYYQYMLRLNMNRCSHLLTVSETSKKCLMERYGLSVSSISVVPNSFEFQNIFHFENNQHHSEDCLNNLRLFYSGGADHRKNVRRLIQALDLLADRGIDATLYVTGNRDASWEREITELSKKAISRLQFLGRLDLSELTKCYASADAVVYPTLCEGFGRVCLEAIAVGTPLACSDLPVLREVSGDYPVYFNPLDVSAIADGIVKAVKKGRQIPRLDERFSRREVAKVFIETIDRILAKEFPVHA